ncbi:MAG: DUF5702 domain-containing protein [Eubacteriales bacterium]|nr:DUF5702 domain-containing protein [Eubacteriales bacterium]
MRRKKRRAEVSLFFAVIMMLVCALIFSIAESARLQSARLYMLMAANSSIQSLFSQYHRKLWDDYRILGLEHYSDRQLEDELQEFIKPYFEVKDMYPMSIKNIEILEKELITDRNGEVFEKEILDYMKYGLMIKSPPKELIIKSADSFKEAVSTEAIGDRYYKEHIRDAIVIEDIIEKIKDRLKEQESVHKVLIRSAQAYDLEGVISSSNKIQEILAGLPELVNEYNRVSVTYYEKLLETESRINEDFKNNKFSKTVYDYLISEMNIYKDYFDSDGKRSKEINSLKESSAHNIQYLDQLIEMAELAEIEVNDYVSGHEGEEPDIGAIWQPVIDECIAYKVLKLNVISGSEDKEKRKKLESIMDMRSDDLLELLLPKDIDISKQIIETKDFPSKRVEKNDLSGIEILDRFYAAEYMEAFMPCYTYPETENKNGLKFLCLEYILKGNENNRKNLQEIVKELLTLRTGLNLIYLYGDVEKKSEAFTLAMQISGVTGFAPFTGVIKNLILASWAFGQAMCDTRDLLEGKGVPLMHSKEDFYLSINEIFEIANKNIPETENNTQGLLYKDYLKLMLICKYKSIYSYRAMDMMQLNIRLEQEDFLIERCSSSIKAGFKAKAGRVFTRLRLLENISGRKLDSPYSISFTATEHY